MLSTKARYAVRAMTELSYSYQQGPVLLRDIARRQQISAKYLEQLMAPLRACGLLYTMRGSKGGYVLGRDPEKVTLYEVITVVEGSLAPVPCVDNSSLCDRVEFCAAREVWERLKDKIAGELQSVSLADLARRQEQLAAGKIE